MHNSRRHIATNILNIIVLILAVLLMVVISYDTFKGKTFYREPFYLLVQLWVCIAFLAVFFIELALSSDKRKFWRLNFFFFLVSIPYQYIIVFLHIHLPLQVTYAIGFIPLIRGGYALAVIVRWYTSNKVFSLVVTYMTILISIVYFSSMAFYLFEKGVNPQVNCYSDALWWACMDVTTVGSNIIAMTSIGRIMSVMLAALGMMMFPIFTVYVATIFRTHNPHIANHKVYEATTRASDSSTSQDNN